MVISINTTTAPGEEARARIPDAGKRLGVRLPSVVTIYALTSMIWASVNHATR